MKILHLVSSGGYYGKEAVVTNLCSALGKLGCAAEIGAFRNFNALNDELVVRAESQHLRVKAFTCRGRLDPKTVGIIRDYLRDEKIDLLHTHDIKANIYGFWAAKGAKRPVFSTCHLWYSATVGHRIYSAVDRFMLRNFNGVVGVSPAIGDILRRSGVSQRKVAVIANGIDFSPFLSLNGTPSRSEFGGDPTIGMVGRLCHQKGQVFLFTAARGILKKFPGAKFVLVGEGPDRKMLETMAQDLGIAGSVHFAGYRDDMPNIYGALDLMVMPSLNEGLPMTLLEAMAARRAVIATAVGAVPEVIQHGKSGWLIAPGDAGDLEQAILSLLGDPGVRSRIAENARQSVAQYSSERMARNYLDFYQRMIGQPNPSD